MRVAPIVTAVLLLSGCLGGADEDDGATPTPGETSLQAPWWEIGEHWTITFEQAGRGPRTTTLVNFANDTFGDPPHFWLGTSDREEAMSHVFFDDDPFLGRIHWELLAPHEKGMHSMMYQWPLEDGQTWTSPILLGKEDVLLEATPRADGTVAVTGEARADGATFAYDHDPATRWFRDLQITEADGRNYLRAHVDDHGTGKHGTFYFLRGRDYLDADGGTTGQEETFEVKEEGATSIAFLLDVQAGPGSRLEFVDPSGRVVHSENLLTGGTSDKVVEIKGKPASGTGWKLRYIGSVTGEIKVRGIIEYSATI